MGELLCPNCGSKVRLPETSSIVTGITFSKQSNGTHYLDMETNNNKNISNTKENKTMNRLEELKANGVDVTGFFAMGNSVFKADTNGNLVPLDDDYLTTLMTKVETEGKVFNSKLDGRWIMAQMFKFMDDANNDRWNESLEAKGYNYQWTFLADTTGYSWRNRKKEGELHRIAKREKQGDRLKEKTIWFNKDLIVVMIEDYCDKLEQYLHNLPIKYCETEVGHKSPYIRLGHDYTSLTGHLNGDLWVKDIDKIVREFRKETFNCRICKSYEDLFNFVIRFKNKMVDITKNGNRPLMCKEFKSAYAGNGAYYTLRNMVEYHNVILPEWINKKQSLAYIEALADEFSMNNEGYKFRGYLKEVIRETNFKFGN